MYNRQGRFGKNKMQKVDSGDASQSSKENRKKVNQQYYARNKEKQLGKENIIPQSRKDINRNYYERNKQKKIMLLRDQQRRNNEENTQICLVLTHETSNGLSSILLYLNNVYFK